MFNRKLKEKVEQLECKIWLQEKKIKQLQCSHSSVKFEVFGMGDIISTGDDRGYTVEILCDVVCTNCQKFIKTVDAKEKARMEYQQAKEQYNKICGGSDDGKTREKQG